MKDILITSQANSTLKQTRIMISKILLSDLLVASKKSPNNSLNLYPDNQSCVMIIILIQ